MPEVPLVATKAFTYRTRRLMAGDEFPARNGLEARILTRVRKVADFPTAKPARKVPEPPVEAEDAASVEAKPAAKKAPAKRKAKAKK